MNDNQGDVVVEEIGSELEDQDTGVPLYKIVSYPADLTLEGLHQRWQREEIIIPPFQRGWVWSHTQASRLIESFLLGLPVPSIFMYKEPSTQKQLVIDGQQRLRTIWGFFDGELPDNGSFYLRGVHPQWEGKDYRALEEHDRIRLRDSVLRTVVVEQLDPADDTSVYHIFERLNTGGTGLSPQEVRNSTYHGPLNDMLVDVNRYEKWREIFGRPAPDPRMRDIELIARFLALYERAEEYTKPMKQFLNSFMARHQRDRDVSALKDRFTDTVDRVHGSLGARPFHVRRGINAAVFDSVMVAFARSPGVPGDIDARLRKLLENPSFFEATSSATTDIDVVKRRIRLAGEVLAG